MSSEAHEIIGQVQDAHPEVVNALARITAKTTELFHSHAREPKTHNPASSGNVSPVTHFMTYCRQYNAAGPGAGLMLNNRVHAELAMEFADAACSSDLSQKQLHAGVLEESYDVLKCLNECDFAGATDSELKELEEQAAQLRDQSSDLISHVRAIRRLRSAKSLTDNREVNA